MLAASVLFHDGLSHTIPGDPAFANGDRIDLDLASILVVNPTAQVIGPPLTLNDTGGTIGGLLAHPGTTLQIDGGEIRGGPVTGFSDENTPSTGFSVYAGEGVDSLGNLMITAGSIEGGAAGAVVDPAIERIESIAGHAIVVSGPATIMNGLFQGGNATCEGSAGDNVAVSGDALIASANSLLVVQGGSYAGGLAHAANGFYVAGNALAQGGNGLSVIEDQTVTVRGGSFEGGSAWADAGFVSGAATATPGKAVRVADGARVAIYAGSFTTGFAAASSGGSPHNFPPVAALRLDVAGSAFETKITLLGGTFRSDSSLEIPFSSEVASDARVDILGGDLDSGNAIDLRLAHPDVTTTIYANDLELDGNPVANPIVATSGTISGVFVDGQTFSWTFERLNDAPLVVTEPALGLAPGLFALGALARLRKLDRA